MRAVALSVLLAAGCVQTDFDPVTNPEVPPGGGIGGEEWRDDDVTCASDDECYPGEACTEGVCQLVRCREDEVESEPPFGAFAMLLRDRELLVVDGSAEDGEYWIDGYSPEAGHVGYPGSWRAGTNAVVDVAGGNLLGEAPERFAVATQGSSTIFVPETDVTVDAGGEPKALAAGDVDGDGTDELMVLLDGGAAICNLAVDAPACDRIEAAGGSTIDVVVANFGDGPATAVFLLEVSGKTVLDVWRPGAEVERAELDSHLDRIAPADLDGDGTDEIVGFRDDDLGFWAHASVHAYRLGADGASAIAEHQIHDSTVDIDALDLDGDGISELFAIRSDGDLEVLRAVERGFESAFVTDLLVSDNPRRLALSDIDGDSVGGELVGGPRLVSAPVVPTVVVQFPPHSSEFSDGLPSVLIGRTDQMTESTTDTVSLSLGVSVGVGASLFDLFSGSLSTSVQRELSRSRTEEKAISVGERFSIAPDPERPGLQYGAVVVAGGCFHAYDYDVNGEPMVVLVPVDGNAGVWSTPRYNAMAKALGDLPLIEIETVIGDPASYPAEPTKLDGSEIPADDLVFEDPPELFVGDIGEAGWWLTAAESTTLTEATTTTVSIDAEVGVAGVKFGGHVGESLGQAYSLRIGEEAIFAGSVPAIPDVVGTPEDEHALHAFSFSPYVYRERYERPDGSDAGYYVLGFTVAQ
jgi:hypothetical protein